MKYLRFWIAECRASLKEMYRESPYYFYFHMWLIGLGIVLWVALMVGLPF